MPILDWIFEGIVGWVSSITAKLMDAVSGLFLEALGTDMTAMEEYFPFVTKAYGVMQVMAYAILILIVLWQIFRASAARSPNRKIPCILLSEEDYLVSLSGMPNPFSYSAWTSPGHRTHP